jgi:hypothetical protein
VIGDGEGEGKRVVREASGATAGALVGLALGGPVGALVGAALAPAVTATLSIMERSARRRFERASATVERAAEMAGSAPAELEDLLAADDHRLEIALAVLTAAAGTTLIEKAEALSAALAATATANQTELDQIELAVHSIESLGRLHIQTLVSVGMFAQGVTPADLGAQIGCDPTDLRPIVRQLELNGLITDAGRMQPNAQTVLWSISVLGQLLVDLLSSGTRLGKTDVC